MITGCTTSAAENSISGHHEGTRPAFIDDSARFLPTDDPDFSPELADRLSASLLDSVDNLQTDNEGLIFSDPLELDSGVVVGAVATGSSVCIAMMETDDLRSISTSCTPNSSVAVLASGSTLLISNLPEGQYMINRSDNTYSIATHGFLATNADDGADVIILDGDGLQIWQG